MNNLPPAGETRPKVPGMVRRKAINTAAENMVNIQLLEAEHLLPLLIQPATDGVELVSWATYNHGLLEQHLYKYGAILFRGFPLHTAEDFERLITGIAGEPLEYRERSSPRSQISGNIYTSTDHPADQHIFLHNENSYQQIWPLRICFFCKVPAQQGGETPIADVRRVYQRIPVKIRERFREKRILYVRNFGDGLGLSWQTVFQTTQRQEVEAHCRKAGMDYEWKDDNHLRTRRVGQAVARHPQTGELLWFNHAAFFHITTLEPQVRNILLAQFAQEDLPSNTYYGDGTPIEDSVMDELRYAYQQETIVFPWQKGDVLLLDNMLTAHGRTPFVGPRQILTGMAMPVEKSADSQS